METIGPPYVYSREYTRRVAKAWDRLVASYPIETTDVRGLVVESWRRCQAHGVDPGRNAAEIANGAPPDRHSHRLLREVVQASLPRIAAYLTETRSVLIASDASGVLLAVEGDQSLADSLALNRAVPGAAWHEHHIGTNAIGTALALQRPVQIHGQEHFCEAGKRWSCTAAPICDPTEHSILGVIDVTGPANEALAQASAFVMAMAERIHALLIEKELLDRARLFELFADAKPRVGETVLFDRRGQVLKATAGARIGGSAVQAGMRLPGLDADSVAQWSFGRLPDSVRQEWLIPLNHQGNRLGGMLRLPARAAQSAAPSPATLAPPLQRLLDASPSLAALLAQAQRYATRRMPLLLQGETGTGKDLLASMIHRAGPTPDAPFIAVNCAALPRELIASELFGYTEGAFTGARRGGAKGKFEQAHGGTIFLDEIGDMPLDLQPYLLRALEERTITRLGETTARRIDVRVIAATNRPLALEVAEGRFRPDLFYRLNGAAMVLPPLRDRLDDLPQLVEHLLREIVPRDVTPPVADETVLATLRSHDWPGNVRELRNVLEQMVALSPEGVLDPACSGLTKPRIPVSGQLRSTEKAMILAALAAAGGSATAAARTLGISRATIYRRLNTYRVHQSRCGA